VYGEKGGIAWRQMEPNTLTVMYQDKPSTIYRTGWAGLEREAIAHTRIPAGHPEGYLEAFANIYRNFAFCIQARLSGEEVDPLYTDFPSIEDGLRGMNFVEKVVASKGEWIKM
jgi:predicted dehydrogenase